MNITLPKKINANFKNLSNVTIENGILKIKRGCSFRHVMYELTYMLKGRNKCYYCGNIVEPWQITLDHRYPRDFGGPTITNNLIPCCKECNVKKDNFTAYQFKKLAGIQNEQEFTQKANRFHKENFEIMAQRRCYILPKKWIKMVGIGEIKSSRTEEQYRKSKLYRNTKKFFNVYHVIKKPIVLDMNYHILDGRPIYKFALDRKLKYLPAIILENVRII